MDNPCTKECPERSATCRLTCKRGREYFEERQAIYAARQAAKQKSDDIAAYIKGEAEKNRRRKQRRPRKRKKN